jgi:hypothetical protein
VIIDLEEVNWQVARLAYGFHRQPGAANINNVAAKRRS